MHEEPLICGLGANDEITRRPLFLYLITLLARQKLKGELTGDLNRGGILRKCTLAFIRSAIAERQHDGEHIPVERPSEVVPSLARFAFQSRCRNAFGTLPAELTSSVECPMLALAGRIFSREQNGDLIFCHESFQEYLCAEHLLRDPDAANSIPVDALPRWSRIFALMAEIRSSVDELPPPVVKAAYKVSPWIGVALSSSGQRNLLAESLPGEHYVARDISRVAFGDKLPKGANETIRSMIRSGAWYDCETDIYAPLRDILNAWPAHAERWRRFEAKLFLGLLDKVQSATIIFRHFMMLDLHDIRDTLQKVTGLSWEKINGRLDKWFSCPEPHEVFIMIKSGIMAPDDFPPEVKASILSRIGYLTPNIISKLISVRFLCRDEIRPTLAETLRTATPQEIAKLVTLGLVQPFEFADRLSHWLEHPSCSVAVALCKAGIASPTAFGREIDAWIRSCDPQIALQLIQVGLAKPSAFLDVLPKWLDKASPTDLAFIEMAQVLTRDDARFRARLNALVRGADANIALELCRRKLATFRELQVAHMKVVATATPLNVGELLCRRLAAAVDFVHQVPNWIARATPAEARGLIDAGLATHEDFSGLVRRWMKNPDVPNARPLFLANLITANSSRHCLPTLIRKARPIDALTLMRLYHLTADSFRSRWKDWIGSCSEENCVLLISHKIVAPDFLANCRPAMFISLYSKGFVARGDVDANVKRWLAHPTPEIAVALVAGKILEPQQFAAEVPRWIDVVSPETAHRMVSVGLCKKENFRNRFLSWIRSPHGISKIIHLGLSTRDELREIILSCKEEFAAKTENVETLYRLLELGVVTFADIPDERRTLDLYSILLRKGRLADFAPDSWPSPDTVAVWKCTADPRVIKRLVASGLAREGELNSRNYTLKDLVSEKSRRVIRDSLKGTVFKAKCIMAGNGYGFLRHPAIEGNVFIGQSVAGKVLLAKGQKWSVTIEPRQNPKTGQFNYMAVTASCSSSGE